MMSLHEEESRRLRAQVEALVAENYELRTGSFNETQSRQLTSRPWSVTQGGFPGLGWLGRGLGSIIGGSPPPPPQPMDLGGNHSGQGSQMRPAVPPALKMHPIPPPPPPPTSCVTKGVEEGNHSAVHPAGFPKAPTLRASGLVPSEFPRTLNPEVGDRQNACSQIGSRRSTLDIAARCDSYTRRKGA